MKQIEKAAEKYALECQREEGYPSPMYDSYDAKDMRECAFKSGAEWQAKQSPWISVDEKPIPSSGNVIAITAIGDVYLACTGGCTGIQKSYSYEPIFENITHWMPIPEFDE